MPCFDDAAAFEHGDAVGERDRRRPVGDHERRAALHHLGEGSADLVLLGRVDGRGGVVEDEHGRVGEDRAGDRDPLPLAAREREAALAEHRLVAVGQVVHERGRAGQLGGAADVLVVRVRPPEADVLAHALAEQERLLEDERDRAADVGDAQLAQVVTVEQHAALLGVVQTSEEAGDGALARAGGADEGERLARRDVQVEPVEHEAVALVAEADAIEPDVTLRVELDRMARLAQLRLGLEHFRDPAARGECLLQRRHALAEHAQRPDEHHHVSVEGHERADGQIAVDHAAAADPEHGGDPEQRQHLEHRDEDRVEPREREGAVHDLDAAAAEPSGQRVAGAEPFDDADPADGLLDERRRLGPAGLQLAGALVVLARVEPRADGHERHRDQHHQREPPVEDQHHDRNRDHGQDVADRVPDRVHHPRDVLRVRRGAAQQLARADAVVVGRVEPQRVREERVADACVRVRAVANRVQMAKGAGADLEQPDCEQHE